MNFLDLVIALAVAGAAYLGYRLGFLRRMLSWAGLVLGLIVAVAFVDDIALMPQTIVEQARAGDVVISMGAGSIGNVPALVSEMLSAKGAAA